MWSSTLQHDGDGGGGVVHVERAALGYQLDEAGAGVVVADVERNGDTVHAGAGAEDGKAGHPHDIPYAELGIRDLIPSK